MTVQDIVELTKMTHDKKKGKSVYEMLTVDAASENSPDLKLSGFKNARFY